MRAFILNTLISPINIPFTQESTLLDQSDKNAKEVRKVRAIFGPDDRKLPHELTETDYEKYNNSLAVAKVILYDNKGHKTGTATAWRLGPGNLMMSNSHVLSEKNIKNAQILFTLGEHGCEVNDYKCANYYDRKFAVSPERILSSSPSQKSNKLDKNHLDYSLFTLDENVFENGYLDEYGYLEIDPNGAMVGDKIHIPQHGIYKNGHEKTIAYNENYPLFDKNSNYLGDIKTESFVKGVKGMAIKYHTDTTPGSSGSPVINSDNNKVIALNFGETKSENYGVNMKYIWPHIKDYYIDSLKEKDNMINHIA